MTKKILTYAFVTSMLFARCNQPNSQQTSSTTANSTKPSKVTQDINFTYRAYPLKDSGLSVLKSRYDTNQLKLIYALNRVDNKHASRLDTLIIPDKIASDIMPYSPFPKEVPFLKDVNKIIFFSYPDEAFAAYDHGKLVRWGPTSLGRKKDSTPTGLTYVNWKKEVDTSTVKDEWILKWNVNIYNKGGIGFHQYDLPGYPASHSCLRLLDNDAEFLYNWVDQWITKGTDDIIAHGTPVEVFGTYPFGSRKPWLGLVQNPHALDITTDELQKIVSPDLQKIMAEQQKLSNAMATKSKS